MIPALRTFLLADSTINGLVGTRIYPMILPQGVTFPAVTMAFLSGDNVVSNDGPSGLANPVLQIDCWGETWDDANALFEAVRKRISGYSGSVAQGIFLARQRDLYDDEPKVYRRSADWTIWHEESQP